MAGITPAFAVSRRAAFSSSIRASRRSTAAEASFCARSAAVFMRPKKDCEPGLPAAGAAGAPAEGTHAEGKPAPALPSDIKIHLSVTIQGA